MKSSLFSIVFLILISSCAFKAINRTKDIRYTSKQTEYQLAIRDLNVFAPKKGVDHPVLLFFYGGSWESGKKEMYDFLGSRLARRGIVTVIADYPLAPDYQIQDMENAATEALLWTKYNIKDYGGDPEQIVVSGHSAGAHLASLLAVKQPIWDSLEMENPVSGAILNDPAGLDMKWFLEETQESGEGEKYYAAFSEDPKVWKEFSTIYFLEGDEPPILILEGTRTYPGIALTVDRFMEKADSLSSNVRVSEYNGKKHIPMITQFFWTWSKGYTDVKNFMGQED